MRAHVFELDPSGKVLSRLDSAGRDHDARDFDLDDQRSEVIRQMLFGTRESLFVQDVSSAGVSDQFAGRTYATFISVPIRSPGATYGLLTIDADTSGALTEVDVKLMQVIASTLCVYFAEAARGAHAR